MTSCSASARLSCNARFVGAHTLAHTQSTSSSRLTSSPCQLVTFSRDVGPTDAAVLELLALHHHILLLLHAELSLPGQHRPNSHTTNATLCIFGLEGARR